MSIEKKDLDLITSEMSCTAVEEPDDTSWIEVTDEASYEMAQTFKTAMNKAIADIKDYFKPRKARAKAVHSDWCQAEKDALKPYEAEKVSVQGKQNAYLAKVEAARIAAEKKIKEAAIEAAEEGEDPSQIDMFIPPAPKVKGSRTTYAGGVYCLEDFIKWAVEDKSLDVYIELKKSALNTLAATVAKSGKKIPGFEARKNVTAV